MSRKKIDTHVRVPNALLPKVRRLIAEYRAEEQVKKDMQRPEVKQAA